MIICVGGGRGGFSGENYFSCVGSFTNHKS